MTRRKRLPTISAKIDAFLLVMSLTSVAMHAYNGKVSWIAMGCTLWFGFIIYGYLKGWGDDS